MVPARSRCVSVSGAVLVVLFGIFSKGGAFSLSTVVRYHLHTSQQPSGNSRDRRQHLNAQSNNDCGGDSDESGYDVFSPTQNRRRFLRDQWMGTTGAAATTLASSAALGGTAWGTNPRAAFAANPKSRTDGYAVQRAEREWSYILSGPQYYVLRRGGTERQKSSILNTFTASDHVGSYVCAACPTALFASEAKFSSGTGWPSFARALEGVEAEELDPIRAALGGREVRCGTCGGHLGDLFNDGWVYVGTTAFETGNRYCIDGAALVFQPEGGGDIISGDVPPPNKVINYDPAVFRDKSINGR